MITVISNAQDKCNEATALLGTLTITHEKQLLKFAIDNVYKSIMDNNIPELVERTKSLNSVYISMKYRR